MILTPIVTMTEDLKANMVGEAISSKKSLFYGEIKGKIIEKEDVIQIWNANIRSNNYDMVNYEIIPSGEQQILGYWIRILDKELDPNEAVKNINETHGLSEIEWMQKPLIAFVSGRKQLKFSLWYINSIKKDKKINEVKFSRIYPKLIRFRTDIFSRIHRCWQGFTKLYHYGKF